MATPTDVTYSGASGAVLAGGLDLGPAYALNLAVGEVAALANSSPSAVGIDGYCGFAYWKEARAIVYGAAGGHSNGADNSVNLFPLMDDAPVWQQLHAASTSGNVNNGQPINLDGTPNAVHLYSYIHVDEERSRMLILGSYAPSPGSDTFNDCHAFNLLTNQWETAGTVPACIGGRYGNCAVGDGSGDVWALWDHFSNRYFDASANAWTNPSLTGDDVFVRFPWARDTLRGQNYGLAWGDSQGSLPTEMRSVKLAGTVKTTITLSGSGLTQFQTDAAAIGAGGQYPAMVYDEANDRFIWYCGKGSTAGHFFAITPNGTNAWTITQLTITGATVPASVDEGIQARMAYADLGTVKGIVFMPGRVAGCYFLRTA